MSPIRGALPVQRHGGGGGSGGLSFLSQTSWAKPAPATPAAATTAGWTMVPFTTKAGLDAALAALSGSSTNVYIYYNGTGVLTISSSSTNAYTLQGKNPTGPVVIDFGTKNSVWGSPTSGNYVEFNFTGSSGFNALWFYNCSNLRLYGGSFTSTHGGILVYGTMNNVIWYDFVCHDLGGPGIQFTPLNGDITNCTFRGEVYNFALNPALDVHPDKGTGLHCCLIENSNPSSHNFNSNTVAIYGHDSLAAGATSYGQTWPEGGGGSCIEIGNSNPPNQLNNNTLYAKAENLNMVPNGTNPGSTIAQTGGNVINLWGNQPLTGLTIGWVEGNHVTGALVHGTTATAWHSTPINVLHGRHTNANLSTAGGNISTPYGSYSNVNYTDCT